MSQIQENIVYMILYNYQDADYSVIKIMSTLRKAIRYIQEQEIINQYTDIHKLNLVEINTEKDIFDKCIQDYNNVCLFNNDTYLARNFRDINHISSYIIVKTVVE